MLQYIRQDLQTYQGDWSAQGFWVMVVYRFGRWRYTLPACFWRKPFSFVYKFCYKLIQIITGIELPCEVAVGEGFRIDHAGSVVVSGYARFGKRCILRNGVTIGLKNLDDPRAPEIGDQVNIGAGAKCLGPIRIGNNVDIGANAVVITDVPDNCIAVGIPARIIPKKESVDEIQNPIS